MFSGTYLHKLSRYFSPFVTLRTRLILLVLLAILPALGFMFYTAAETRQQEEERVRAQALTLARLASRNQLQMVNRTRDLLAALAQLPELQGNDAAACHAQLARIAKLFPDNTGFGLAKPNGDLLCSSFVLTEPRNVADRLWFQRVLRTHDFAIGEYQIGSLINRPILAFGYPVLNEAGQLNGLLSTGVDLGTLNQLVTPTALPDEAILLILDHEGTILTREPEPEKWMGKSLPDASLIQAALSQKEGVIQAPDVEGVPYLYAFSTVMGPGEADLYLAVGIPPQIAFAAVDQTLTRNLIGLGLGGLLALLLAWFGSEPLILRQVRATFEAARRLQSGDLSARTGVIDQAGEFGQLARAFDEMATALEQREAQRQQAELGLRQSEERFRIALKNSQITVFNQDRNLRYTWFYNFNAPFEIAEMLGHTDAELMPTEDAAPLTAIKREVIANGQSIRREIDLTIGGKVSFYDLTIEPLRNGSGEIIGITGAAVDITSLKQSELMQTLLAKVSPAMAIPLDETERLANVAKLIVTYLAEWCCINLIKPDGSVRLIAAAHREPDKVALIHELAARYPLDLQAPAGTPYVLRTRQTEIRVNFFEPMPTLNGDQDPLFRPLVTKLGAGPTMILPLMVRGEMFGAITFVRPETGAPYDEADLALAEELTYRVALALDNAHLYQTEQQARQEAEAATERITGLQAVTAALSRALTPADVVEVIIRHSISVLGASGGAVMLLTEDGASLEMVRAVGYSEAGLSPFLRFPMAASIPASDAVRTGEPVWINSHQDFEARYPHLASHRATDSRTEGVAVVPLLLEDRAQGAIAISFDQPGEFSLEDKDFMLILASQCAQALDRARLYEVEQRARLEAEANQQRLALLAEMRERNRLAQELHDTVAQALGYLNLRIGITYNALVGGQIDSAKANLQELKQVISETYTDVREEIFYLRAKTPSDLNFTELLDRYIDKYRRFYNLDIQLIWEADPTLFEFPPEVTSQLIRTIQEALINIRKHAQVSMAIIRMAQKDGYIRIAIEDQGQGFDPDKIKEKTFSFGLQIMQERVESVGGNLEIVTATDQGTRIVLHYKR